MTVLVVTNPENGWDCVNGVYMGVDEDELREILNEGYGKDTSEMLIIHEKTIIIPS